MPSTPWWTCARCETVLRAGMSFCWECGEAVPSNAAPGDPRRKESGAVLVYLHPEDARTARITLWKDWGGPDQELLAESQAVWTNYYGDFSDELGSSGDVAVLPRVWHGDYTIVLFPDRKSDEPTITTPVTVADGELAVVDWR